MTTTITPKEEEDLKPQYKCPEHGQAWKDAILLWNELTKLNNDVKKKLNLHSHEILCVVIREAKNRLWQDETYFETEDDRIEFAHLVDRLVKTAKKSALARNKLPLICETCTF
jgi:ssDNA-binding Zn-finger/Zn-ribbon topoisomerase 1